MAQLGKGGYTRQLVIFLSQADYEKAYAMGKEFVAAFDKEMLSHFLLAKSAFWLQKYEEAALEGRKAFNLADNPDDMLPCAVLSCTAYFELRDYDKGLELLQSMEKMKTSEELEELLFIFHLVLENDKDAVRHLDALYGMNRKSAEDLLLRFL